MKLQVEIDKYFSLIVEKLKKLHPYKIILFGSYAWGNPDRDSDIDLIVVTNDDFIPETYEEKMKVHYKVSGNIRDLRMKIPMDLIVYTKPMYKRFLQLGSQFSKEISEKGIILYEGNSKRMVK